VRLESRQCDVSVLRSSQTGRSLICERAMAVGIPQAIRKWAFGEWQGQEYWCWWVRGIYMSNWPVAPVSLAPLALKFIAKALV